MSPANHYDFKIILKIINVHDFFTTTGDSMVH